ncbi:MAG: helix-turn-helix transcriptional regulator [Streptosporangiales bacterium]|nr:helix-turn-helix transcriptional regulator [Streptosporangiales bacterium]MBO0892263.1 helix-turn-helix transcriptional regulator [Acidothermales bacterium]
MGGKTADRPTRLLAFFGRHLARMRAAHGMTQQALADEVGYSPQTIGMVEQGRRPPSERLAQRTDELFGADGEFMELWEMLREDLTRHGVFADFVAAEAEAREIANYEGHVIPGLLQTEAYTRAIVGSNRPPLAPADVEAKVALAMSRQALLDRADPPVVWTIIDEAALHRQVGGREIMRAQLDRLLDDTGRHMVTIQVLPFDSAVSPAMGRSFHVLTFADDRPDAAYHEAMTGGAYFPDRVEAAVSVFNHMRAEALPETESAALIEARRKELEL